MSDIPPPDERTGRLRLLEAELARIGETNPTLTAVTAAFRVVVEEHRTIETKVRAELERAKSDFTELLAKIPAIVERMVALREEQIARERAEETLMTPDEEAKMWRDDARRTAGDIDLLRPRLSMLEREARVLKKTIELHRRELIDAVTSRNRAVTAMENLKRQWRAELTTRERLTQQLRQSEEQRKKLVEQIAADYVRSQRREMGLEGDLSQARSDLELTESERDVLVAENQRLQTMLADRGVSPTAFE